MRHYFAHPVRACLSRLCTIGLIIAATSLYGTPARAAGNCTASVSGPIGAKWQDFGAGHGAIGCPVGAIETNAKLGATFQNFEFGTIMSIPALGSNMTFSAWWLSPSKIHIEFTGLADYHQSYRVNVGGTTYTLPGGTGHNRDYPANSPNVPVYFYWCDASCVANTTFSFNPNILLTSGQLGALVNRQKVMASAPAPAPAPFAGTTLSLPTAQIRSYYHEDALSRGTGNGPCSHICEPPWLSLGWSDLNSDNAPTIGLSNTPASGYIYDDNTGFFGDSHLNQTFRLGFLFDLSHISPSKLARATLVLHGTSWSNFDTAGILCGSQLGLLKSDWWDSPHQNLDNATFANALNAGSSTPNAKVDVTEIVKNWLINPQSNYGFVLRNPDESLGQFKTFTCLTKYDHISLDLDVNT